MPGSVTSKALLKRGLAVGLNCLGACTITAELRYKTKKLGSARKTLLKAGTAKLVVKVSRKAARTVRGLKRGKLTLLVQAGHRPGREDRDRYQEHHAQALTIGCQAGR